MMRAKQPHDRPTILFVNHWAHAPGGAEYSLADILRHCAAVAHVHLVTTENGWLVDQATRCGVTTHVLKVRHPLQALRRHHLLMGAPRSLPGLASYCSFLIRLRQLVKRLSPAIVHANVPKSHIAIPFVTYGITVCRVLHIREIFAPRGSVALLYRVLFASRAYTLLCISEAVRTALPPPLNSRGVVIYNGIEVPPLATSQPEQHAHTRFVYLGRIVPWKGIHTLIACFADLLATYDHHGASLQLIGDTRYWDQSYRSELTSQIDANAIGHACTLHPHTDNPYAALRKSTVFVCAADKEPFGRSIAQAQACGLPVIAWNSGGIGEIVDNLKTGFLIQQGNTREFCMAMERYCREPGLATHMGALGHKRMKELFEVETQMGKIRDFLLTLPGHQTRG